MKERGVTTATLAAGIGVSGRTIENILCENSTSRIARQKISDFLAADIWPNTKAQTAIGTIPESTVFLRLTRQQADDLHEKFPSSTRIVNSSQGFIVEFLEDTPAIISLKSLSSKPGPLPLSKAVSS